jgi:hypothetical protein
MIYLRPLNRRTRTDCSLGLQLTVKRNDLGLRFFHSLFAWLSLLTAFKMWMDAGIQDTQVMINGRLYDLKDLEVSGSGKRLSLKVEGKRMSRSKVNMIGVVVEVDGKLIIDTTGDYYTDIQAGISAITVEDKS